MKIFLFFSIILLFLNSTFVSAKQEFTFFTPYEKIGPQNADGALIWMHGWCVPKQSCIGSVPPFLYNERNSNNFYKNNWDIYRINIPGSRKNHDNVGYYKRARYFAKLVLPQAEILRKKGYRRVVIAGQSGGAMGVIFASTLKSNVDAIIATAPCCGTGKGKYIPESGVYKLLKKSKSPRLAIFFFDRERHAPRNISQRSAKALKSTNTVYRLYDEPEQHLGHGAANTMKFANEFAEELVKFASGDPSVETNIRITKPKGSVQAYEKLFEESGKVHVMVTQEDLKNKGYYSGAIDGIYGRGTRGALLRCVQNRDCSYGAGG